jgi:predicted RNase H-like nuclease
MFDRNELKSRLHEGVCKVAFTKVNGETRIMHCTLNESMIPAVAVEKEKSSPRKENVDVIAAWDVEKKDWRSFRLDSITMFSAEHNV